MERSTEEHARAVLKRLGPALAVDGGGVQFVRIEGGTLYLILRGACRTCPGADITLKYGIESAITQEVDAITRVVAIQEEPNQ